MIIGSAANKLAVAAVKDRRHLWFRYRVALRVGDTHVCGHRLGCGGVSMAAAHASLSLQPISDAHCHPQLDASHHGAVATLHAARVAVMAVNAADWEGVERVCALAPDKAIGAFGIHPWWSHLHASQPQQQLSDLLEARSDADKLVALSKLSSEEAELQPLEAWRAKLYDRLRKHPSSIVGEIGLDRAALVPGTKACTAFSHQMQLFEMQLQIAAELGRPVSVHCVRAYGHLLHVFMALSPDQCPPKVMLHSYGGSVDDIGKLLKLKNGVVGQKGRQKGVQGQAGKRDFSRHDEQTGEQQGGKKGCLEGGQKGDRFYFSFSAVINGRQREKLVERIRAVPEDRLLIESDEVVVARMDGALQDIAAIVAEARGWSMAQVAEVTSRNFDTFYGQHI